MPSNDVYQTMYNEVVRVLLIIFCIFISSKSFAQNQSGPRLTIGGGVSLKQNNRINNNLPYYRSPTIMVPYPVISFRNGRLLVNGYTARYTLGGGPLAISAMVKWQGDPYRTKYVEHRRSSFFGGVSGRIIFLSFSYLADLNNKSQGQIGELALSHRVRWSEQFFQVVRLGQEYLNPKYVHYYYGVKESEAVEFEAYSPGSTKNKFISLSNFYRFGGGLGSMMSFKYKYLGDEVYHSPTTKRRSEFSSVLFLNYTF